MSFLRRAAAGCAGVARTLVRRALRQAWYVLRVFIIMTAAMGPAPPPPPPPRPAPIEARAEEEEGADEEP